jgi:hypothetical protein
MTPNSSAAALLIQARRRSDGAMHAAKSRGSTNDAKPSDPRKESTAAS